MVASALTEELASLSVPARLVLDGASVAGDPFELDLAAAAADRPEPAVLEAIDELGGEDFVRPTDMPRRFRFRHPIVRRAVYEAAPSGWRIAAHERVAEALGARGAEAASRASHVERSAHHGDRRAIAVLRDAGTETLLRAPATAAHWFASALEMLPSDAGAQERVELLLPMARALTATGQWAEGRAALLESLAIAPSGATALRTELAATTARVEHLLGLHEQAHDRLVRCARGAAGRSFAPRGCRC